MKTCALFCVLTGIASPVLAIELDPVSHSDIRCIALLGSLQGARKAGVEYADLPADLDSAGRRWSPIALREAQRRTGHSDQQLADLVQLLVKEEVSGLQRGDVPREKLQERVDICVAHMESVLSAE